jgi:hypothetical protein
MSESVVVGGPESVKIALSMYYNGHLSVVLWSCRAGMMPSMAIKSEL